MTTYQNPIQKHGDFADPFVLRFNGRYYLYCTNPGVRCWQSDDLLHWTMMGEVVPEDEFPGLVPFAPEVVYENGWTRLYLFAAWLLTLRSAQRFTARPDSEDHAEYRPCHRFFHFH